MCIKFNTPKIIFVVAFKAEIPLRWIEGFDVNIYSLDYLQKQSLNFIKDKVTNKNILFLIIGKGQNRAYQAAEFITKYFNPIVVINLGSCGLLSQNYPIGTCVIPQLLCEMKTKDKIFVDNKIVPIPLDSINILRLSIAEPTYSVDDVSDIDLGDLKNLEHNYKNVFIDMESYFLAKILQQQNICFLAIKYITDYIDINNYDDTNVKKELMKNLKQIRLNLVNNLFSFFKLQVTSEIGVSVIIPTYNRKSCVVNAINSVLNQKHKPKEVIVVDDGSNDNTYEDLKAIFKDKIQIIRLDKNYGVSYARNIGVQNSCEQWICFLDSDDMWTPVKLENQLKYLKQNPFFEILQSEEIWIRNQKRVNACKHHKKKEGWIWDISLLRCMISPSSVMLKKSLFEKFKGFDTSFPVCEDYDLWLQITRYYPVGLESTQSLVKYGGHSDQLSKSFEAFDKYRVLALIKALNQEYDKTRCKKIFEVLEQKLNILINGAKKRDKNEDIQKYQNLYIKAKQMYDSKIL